MSRNHFQGSIPALIGDMNFLEDLDLSHNQLSGGLPEHLVMGCSSLFSLTLSNNSLQGQMFSSKFNLTNLRELRLDGNHFSGKIPDSLSNCFGLTTLDVSNNELVGGIPSVAYNNLSGSTPVMTAQFSTFEESSYVGNHFLCGKPLPKNCSTSGPSSLPEESTDKGLIDMTAFYASFVLPVNEGNSCQPVRTIQDEQVKVFS
ncbi:hypothetical protein GQ457_08G000260 [Hibiscus cannabinus]